VLKIIASCGVAWVEGQPFDWHCPPESFTFERKPCCASAGNLAVLQVIPLRVGCTGPLGIHLEDVKIWRRVVEGLARRLDAGALVARIFQMQPT
jgi:hypothetical protein